MKIKANTAFSMFNNGDPMAFAIYKNDKFIGFRIDTFGSVNSYPKVYSFSQNTIDIVLKSSINQYKEHSDKIKIGITKLYKWPEDKSVYDYYPSIPILHEIVKDFKPETYINLN